MKNPARMTGELIRSLFKKPFTELYPFLKKERPDGFRGRIEFDPARCIGCKLCMRDCPSGAINIIKIAEKKFEAEINLARCIYCAQCAENCNKEALSVTKDYELAQIDVKKLKIVYKHGEPEGSAEE